jgi:hypothetical protein
MPRRRSKPLIPKTENIIESAQWYADNLSRLYRHDPQRVSTIVEELYVGMLFVNENYADADFIKKQNELVQKEGR